MVLLVVLTLALLCLVARHRRHSCQRRWTLSLLGCIKVLNALILALAFSIWIDSISVRLELVLTRRMLLRLINIIGIVHDCRRRILLHLDSVVEVLDATLRSKLEAATSMVLVVCVLLSGESCRIMRNWKCISIDLL